MGFKDLFRGHVAKDQKGADFNYKKYGILNKILVKNTVLFYSKFQKNSNEAYHY